MNRLEEQYDQATFLSLNASADGREAFEALALPGHPSLVVFDRSGIEVFRVVGVPDEAELQDVIVTQLESN